MTHTIENPYTISHPFSQIPHGIDYIFYCVLVFIFELCFRKENVCVILITTLTVKHINMLTRV